MAIIESIMEQIVPINEALVITDEKSGAEVHLTPDPTRNYGEEDAYFKFIPDKSVDINHGARISFSSPIYIDHLENTYKLSRQDKKALMRMLNAPSRKDKSITGWVALIRKFNEMISSDYRKDNSKYLLPEDLPIPNYIRLQ